MADQLIYFEGSMPPEGMFKIWCDFNSQGISQEVDDNCFYSFDRISFKNLNPVDGMQIFIWDYSDEDEVIGCVAIIEKYMQSTTGWRARPIDSTWFRGAKEILSL
jgi:hypothetical protein